MGTRPLANACGKVCIHRLGALRAPHLSEQSARHHQQPQRHQSAAQVIWPEPGYGRCRAGADSRDAARGRMRRDFHHVLLRSEMCSDMYFQEEGWSVSGASTGALSRSDRRKQGGTRLAEAGERRSPEWDGEEPTVLGSQVAGNSGASHGAVPLFSCTRSDRDTRHLLRATS